MPSGVIVEHFNGLKDIKPFSDFCYNLQLIGVYLGRDMNGWCAVYNGSNGIPSNAYMTVECPRYVLKKKTCRSLKGRLATGRQIVCEFADCAIGLDRVACMMMKNYNEYGIDYYDYNED